MIAAETIKREVDILSLLMEEHNVTNNSYSTKKP